MRNTKLAEYAAKHANDGKQVDVENMVNARSLLGEIITVKEIVRIEKTKFGNAAYIVKIDDDSGFFTTASMTKAIDRMVGEGVALDEFVGSKFVVTNNHVDEHTDKNGKVWPACDFLSLEFVE